MTKQNDTDVQPYEDEGPPAGRKRRGERLISLLIVGTILLNFPLLSIFSTKFLFLGYPVLFLYFFLIWGLIIGAIVLVLRDRPQISSGSTDLGKKEDR